MGKKKKKLQKQGKVVNLDHERALQIQRQQKVEIIPRNVAQENYLLHLNNRTKRIVFAIGPAGTGKTMIAVKKAVQSLVKGEVERIVITRPAVSVEEKHGFLPGDLNQKMEPWMKPIYDVFDEHFTPDQVDAMMHDGVIEIAPLGFMRGRTFKNAIIILDESQNCTASQMKMFLTRIGEGSRMFITGDLKQSDYKEKSGLNDFFQRFQNDSKSIAQCEFDARHIERDPVVSEVLRIYGEA